LKKLYMDSIASCNRSSHRGLAALALISVIGMLLSSCSMPDLTRVSSQQFPEPQSCAECHVDIYREWQASPHARAFANPRFRAATDDHRFQQCLGCHAPAAAMVTAEPAPRLTKRDLGVFCVACHLDHGAMVGPLPPTGFVKPHPIKVDKTPFENGTLCGHCHEGTLTQWRAANKDPANDCRQCHMPSVWRKTTQATSAISEVFVAAEKQALEHQHAFTLTPTDLPETPFTLDLACEGNQASLTLTNRLPHNLPTGDFGVRIIDIIADGLDAQGHATQVGHWELTNAANGSLPAGQSRQWVVPILPDVRTLRASMARHGRDGAERALLLQKEITLP
jgi:predicted CXXCH cytochrome family protein